MIILAKIFATGALIVLTGNAAVTAGHDGLIKSPGNGWSVLITMVIGFGVALVVWHT